AQPLNDADINDRLQTARMFIRLQRESQPMTRRSWHWIRESIANVREGLLPYLAAPKLSGRRVKTDRSFPTNRDYMGLPDHRGDALLDALEEWKARQPPSVL